MPVFRENPYGEFNFLVDLGTGDSSSVDAGFSEVSGLGTSVSVIEYRNGNDKDLAPRHIVGLSRPSEVTLRRGLIGTMALADWFQSAASKGPDAKRNVKITLLNELREPVMMWTLTNAFPVRYGGPTLSATASAVAIEELVLTCQSITMN